MIDWLMMDDDWWFIRFIHSIDWSDDDSSMFRWWWNIKYWWWLMIFWLMMMIDSFVHSFSLSDIRDWIRVSHVCEIREVNHLYDLAGHRVSHVYEIREVNPFYDLANSAGRCRRTTISQRRGPCLEYRTVVVIFWCSLKNSKKREDQKSINQDRIRIPDSESRYDPKPRFSFSKA